jgi:hypothetical protein
MDLDIERKGHLEVETKNRDGSLWSIERGRPNLRKELHALIYAERTMVLGCGPGSMKIDISNAVASAQIKVLRAEVKEIALHTETFGFESV